MSYTTTGPFNQVTDRDRGAFSIAASHPVPSFITHSKTTCAIRGAKRTLQVIGPRARYSAAWWCLTAGRLTER